jgi:hypothetical protein
VLYQELQRVANFFWECNNCRIPNEAGIHAVNAGDAGGDNGLAAGAVAVADEGAHDLFLVDLPQQLDIEPPIVEQSFDDLPLVIERP